MAKYFNPNAELAELFLEQAKKNTFNSYLARKSIINDIYEYFCSTSKTELDVNVVATIDMSAGADAAIVGALCIEALGYDRVKGIIMPNGSQEDTEEAISVCKQLGIAHRLIDIGAQVKQMILDLGFKPDAKGVYLENKLSVLIRRTVLASITMVCGGRVINTTNATEEFLGYIVKGDNIAGDFAPILNYTKTEVAAIGETFTDILFPHDGSRIRADEERLGFSYASVDAFIREPLVTALAEARAIAWARFAQDPDCTDTMANMRGQTPRKRLQTLCADVDVDSFVRGPLVTAKIRARNEKRVKARARTGADDYDYTDKISDMHLGSEFKRSPLLRAAYTSEPASTLPTQGAPQR